MELQDFSIQELQNIENLLACSKTIDNIYNKLCRLENENKKDTEEYQKLIYLLKETIKIEKKEFNKACKTAEQCRKIFKFLSSAKGLLKYSNNECIIRQKYTDRVIRRTINIVSEQLITYYEPQRKSITKDIIKFLNDLSLEISLEEIYTETKKNIKIQNAISNDMYLLIISILKEYISNKKYQKYKYALTKTKYYISFINPTTETYILQYNFNPTNTIYISSNMTADLLGINKTQYDLIKEIDSILNTAINITQLLDIKDCEYEQTTINIESIIRQSFIRALLTLMNEDSVYELNQNFHNFIESPKYLSKHQNDRISENIIIQCFKSQKYDRPKKRIINIKATN